MTCEVQELFDAGDDSFGGVKFIIPDEMPDHLEDDRQTDAGGSDTNVLPFPPVTKAHIINCSYPNWHSRYRAVTPKSRAICLPQPFLEYLRADGIVLPEDDEPSGRWSDDDSGIFSASDNTDARDDDGDEEDEDIAATWRPTHVAIKSVIAELGGKVVPKLNWSAPKDATWMNANSMECRQPSDIYLLLKSSDFITHDLEHAFDDCVDTPECSMSPADIPYYLVLRKHVQFNPSVEFRCFVRHRRLLAICQRDLNHFDFLFEMESQLRSVIQEFFDVRLRDTFPDENFVFDVYVPAPHSKAWLVDINPWAPRTDPLLFSWLELLTMDEPPETHDPSISGGIVRLDLEKGAVTDMSHLAQGASSARHNDCRGPGDDDNDNDGYDDDDDSVDEELWLPELRLVRKTDPEAYSFSTPQYSAHKLPKDVVDASQSGEGLREFARDWQNILAKRQREDAEAEQSEDDT